MDKLLRVLYLTAATTLLALTQSACEPEVEECWNFTGDLSYVTSDTTASKHGEAAITWNGALIMFTTDYFSSIDRDGSAPPKRDLIIIDMPVGGEIRTPVPTPLDVGGARRVDLSGIADDAGNPIGLPQELNQAWPTWHPDGERFAFILTNVQGFPRLYVCRVDYSAPTSQPMPTRDHFMLDDVGFTGTNTPEDDSYFYITPEFSSPDANGDVWLAYARHFFRPSQGGNPPVTQPQAIYAYNMTTQQVVQVTAGSSRVQKPTWSPDGSRIAFEANYDGSIDLYSIAFDPASAVPRDDSLRRLTKSETSTGDPVPFQSSHASWLSDGSIVFSSTRRAPCTSQRESDIWIMDADGGRQRVLYRSRFLEDYAAANRSGGNSVVLTTQLNRIAAFTGSQEDLVLVNGF